EVFTYVVDQIIEFDKTQGAEILVGPEVRGFIVGCPVAYALETCFAPVRKPNKLPRVVIEVDYGLEYGKNTLTIHKYAVKPGQKVLITDHLLATVSTIEANIDHVDNL